MQNHDIQYNKEYNIHSSRLKIQIVLEDKKNTSVIEDKYVFFSTKTVYANIINDKLNNVTCVLQKDLMNNVMEQKDNKITLTTDYKFILNINDGNKQISYILTNGKIINNKIFYTVTFNDFKEIIHEDEEINKLSSIKNKLIMPIKTYNCVYIHSLFDNYIQLKCNKNIRHRLLNEFSCNCCYPNNQQRTEGEDLSFTQLETIFNELTTDNSIDIIEENNYIFEREKSNNSIITVKIKHCENNNINEKYMISRDEMISAKLFVDTNIFRNHKGYTKCYLKGKSKDMGFGKGKNINFGKSKDTDFYKGKGTNFYKGKDVGFGKDKDVGFGKGKDVGFGVKT